MPHSSPSRPFRRQLCTATRRHQLSAPECANGLDALAISASTIDDLSPRAFAKQDEPVYSGAAASRALPQNLQ
jgi:hypothetical protein